MADGGVTGSSSGGGASRAARSGPAVISIEHVMLDPAGKLEAVRFLEGKGYTVADDYMLNVGEDMLAWRRPAAGECDGRSKL